MKIVIVNIRTFIVTKGYQEGQYFKNGIPYTKSVYKKLKQPIIGVDLKLRINDTLKIGDIWLDPVGKLSYRVSENGFDTQAFSTLINVQTTVDGEFRMPHTLIHSSAPYQMP